MLVLPLLLFRAATACAHLSTLGACLAVPFAEHVLCVGGVFGAGLRLFPWYREDLVKTPFFDIEPISQMVSVVGFTLFCVYLWRYSVKKTS